MVKSEDTLSDIAKSMADLVAMFRLVNADQVAESRDKLLGDGTRRKVWQMADGTAQLSDIAKSLKITPQAVGQHMKLLQRNGLVRQLESGNYQHTITD